MIMTNLFKGGKRHAVTFSYDDGSIFDKRLIEIFNKYGIKGTFHLNSALMGQGNRGNDFSIYEGHEIACHGAEHAPLAKVPVSNVVNEILSDRIAWEKVTGAPVRGLSYADGSYNDDVINALKACGIAYSRTAHSTRFFTLPNDFLAWNPTCHHNNAPEIAERFMQTYVPNPYFSGLLLYIYGHSHEFDRDNNWELIEDVCRTVAHNDNIWYATNIEIYEYVTAARRLVTSADGKIVYNPSCISVWVSYDGKPWEIKGGETIKIP